MSQKYKHINTVPFIIGETQEFSEKQQKALYKKIQAFINKQKGVKCLNHNVFNVDNKDGAYADIISNEFSLSIDEMNKLQALCERLSDRRYYETGLSKLSGGFSKAIIKDFDKETINLEVTFGILDSDGDDINTDYFEVDRETMTIVE